MDEEAATSDMQAVLEGILGFGFEEFIKTIMLGHANFKPFMRLSTPERRQFVDSVLSLEIYTKMAKLHKQNVADLTNQKKNLENDIMQENRIIDTAKRALYMIEETATQNIAEAEKTLADLIAANGKNPSEDGFDAEMKPLGESIRVYENAINKTNTVVRILQDEQTSAEAIVRDLKRQLSKLDTSEQCPTCGGAIDASSSKKHADEINRKIEETLLLTTIHEPRIEKYMQGIRDATGKIKKLGYQIQDLNAKKAAVVQTREKLYRAKEKLDQAIEKGSADTSEFKETIKNSTAVIKTCEETLATIIETKRVHDAATELLKDSGIKAHMIDRFIPMLNKYVNQHLESMNASFKLEIDREFNDKIIGRYKDEFNYTSLSQGERCRVDLAMLFAWLQVSTDASGVGSNLLILDEIGASELDADGVDALFEILDNTCRDKQVFIISHRDDIAQRCRSIIQIEKKNGFSKIN